MAQVHERLPLKLGVTKRARDAEQSDRLARAEVDVPMSSPDQALKLVDASLLRLRLISEDAEIHSEDFRLWVVSLDARLETTRRETALNASALATWQAA